LLLRTAIKSAITATEIRYLVAGVTARLGDESPSSIAAMLIALEEGKPERAVRRPRERTVTRWAHNGKLRHVKILDGHRRYQASEIHALRDNGAPLKPIAFAEPTTSAEQSFPTRAHAESGSTRNPVEHWSTTITTAPLRRGRP
jgi:hypothetical protein